MREYLRAVLKLPLRLVRGATRRVVDNLWPGRRATDEPAHVPSGFRGAPGVDLSEMPPPPADSGPIQDEATISMPGLTVRERLGRGESLLLIDVREGHEVDQGMIPGAVHVPLGQLRARFQEFDPGHTIVCYCASGRRSLDGAQMLRNLGIPRAYSMAGGISRWLRDGGEILRAGEAPRGVSEPDLKGQ